jgi:sulfate transport system ATP-binding protein
VGLVFQNYALFRHMTVADNIEFALRVRRMPAEARRARRTELLRLVALEGLDGRLPAELSGGQQQRVAVARALAHKPGVLLLDEPFGALDAKIREELRRTIRQVQRELGITTVLVTHDQEEAFALADRIGVMNLGRLLEMGKPHDLYSRPTTRFVATFLGAANLLLGRQSRDGLRFGEMPLAISGEANGTAGSRGTREQEVVTVVRPEELEVAPARLGLRSDYLAQAVVEEVLFTGALERMRVRLAVRAGVAGLTCGAGGEALLEITRTQHEQRAFQVAPGQTVALGVRRVHVLPTPLSSFTACARTEAAAEGLARQPLLVELGMRMKTRISARVEPQLGWPGASRESATDYPGTTVISAQPEVIFHVQWLLQRGAAEVLVLPLHVASPQRVLIHWADEPVRRATLAVSASMLRHLSAEAVYLSFQSPADGTQNSMRALLDARREASGVHGLEMRTELSSGEVVGELGRRLAEEPGQMLILGVCNLAQLEARFGRLLTAGRWPVLIVHRDPLAVPASTTLARAQP